MIRKTLPNTKEATFVVTIPDPAYQGFPRPNGTGFFITKSGYFITANHVVNNLKIGDSITLERPGIPISAIVMGAKLIKRWDIFDLALLKADFDENKQREYFNKRKDFPNVDIDYTDQEEGTPVYSFGYPLMENNIKSNKEGTMMIGLSAIPTRVTSAIISSTREFFGAIMTTGDPKVYVIDKALNYGNSGGPIIATETGKVIGACVRFQPMNVGGVTMPSLYSVASSFQNIQADLAQVIKK